MFHPELNGLTDVELIASLRRVSEEERRNVVALLRHLQVMDERRLAESMAYESLFDYCVKELRWAEGETARRIQVARKAVGFPLLLAAIRKRFLNVTTASLLVPHLRRDNYSRLVRAAYGQRVRAVEALVASISPRKEPRERARFLGVAAPVSQEPPASPVPADLGPGAASDEPGLVFVPPQASHAPQRVHFSFTSDERLLADVERAKELLRAKYAAPDFEAVFREAVRIMLERIDPDRRTAESAAPRRAPPGAPRSRVPPAWVRRAVWKRDGGHCSFRGTGDRRCRSRSGLQFDHIVPWALGGRSDDPANIRLLCRAHNRLEARRSLGDGAVDAALAAARERRGRRGS